MPTEPKQPEDYIVSLNINGMDGRMLRLPARKAKQREILLLYGSHSSIERMYSIASELNRYGAVTLPDLPGFGGMDSFFKIGRKPNVDSMADYLAAVIKLRYGRRHFTIAGVSYGIVVTTRMLQRHPDIAKRVDMVVSIAGFVHHEDFHVPGWQQNVMKFGSWACKTKWLSRVANVVINGRTVTIVYRLRARSHSKLKDADPVERDRRIAFEVVLWRINDLRTYFYTAYTMFRLNLCDQRVAVPIYHVAINDDQFFDNYLVEQHLKIIYKRARIIKVTLKAHMPTIIATPEEVAPFIPSAIRRILARS